MCAGIRVGYGAFPAGLIDFIWRAKQPYNVSVASETAACAALTDSAYMQVSACVSESASLQYAKQHSGCLLSAANSILGVQTDAALSGALARPVACRG